MSEESLSERVEKAKSFLREQGVGEPVAAVILGSGLSAALALEDTVAIPYGEIPGFPRGRVPGHDCVLEFGRVAGEPVLVLRGRVHYYEGLALVEVTFPVRVARALGARWIGLVNAAGGLNPSLEVGDIVLLTDHLNLMGDNPLIGPNDDALGPRFPDMSGAYSKRLLERAEAAARAAGLLTRRGVFAAVAGPTYETPAEIRMLQICGADLVGMSIVPETIVAVHAGLEVLGISVVTDMAVPEDRAPLVHDDVLRVAQNALPGVTAVLEGVLGRKET
jgi:purine-nucleoside phosphorylase